MSGQVMLSVNQLVKCYGDFCAVDHLSFEVCAGEIFGLLGPNGAGKTTTIRTVMDIFKADEGQVSVLGRSPGAAREEVGYLPEERGLYRNQRVLDVLVYLGRLKGVPKAEARARAQHWLERVDLPEWGNHKIEDLSRGMQQKVQFVASLVHDPDLLILDEPFAGLDPVNVDLIKRLIRELQAEGKTVVLSAHQMNLVEALCDRILLINRGKGVLYGALAEIKRQYAPQTVRVRTPALPAHLPGVTHVEEHDGTYNLTLAGTGPQELLAGLVAAGAPIEAFEVASVPLEDIFISVVQASNGVMRSPNGHVAKEGQP
jgi:ABC-2 type transport system ATP-binding protein